MHQRTTILLDPPARRAAKRLAGELDISPSEVIRRALVHYHAHVFGSPKQAQRRRLIAVSRLIDLFDGTDAEGEVLRLKQEDRFF